MCSEPVLERLVEPLYAAVSLRVVEGCSNVLDSSPLHKGSEVGRDELGPIIGCDGIWNAPAYEQGGEEVSDHLGGDRAGGEDLRPFGVEIVGDQQKALVLGNAVELATDIQLNVGPRC